MNLIDLIKKQLRGKKPLRELPCDCGKLEPTKSAALHIQMIGRVNREGKFTDFGARYKDYKYSQETETFVSDAAKNDPLYGDKK